MTLGLFNSFLDHQIFVPLGDSISFGTCDFEGGSSWGLYFFLELVILRGLQLGTLFFSRTCDFEGAPVDDSIFFRNLWFWGGLQLNWTPCMMPCHWFIAKPSCIWFGSTSVKIGAALVNKDHQRMMVDPMFMIVQSLRSFLTAVTTTAVAPIAVIFTCIYLNIHKITWINL